MSKRIALLALLGFSFPLLAFHDFVISPDTIHVGDTISFTGSYESVGDTASLFMYIDKNTNGVFDSLSDLNPMQGQTMAITDGDLTNDQEIDTVADGLIAFKMEAREFPFSIPGKLVMIFTSKGIADTASVVILEKPTNTYISGKIIGPTGGIADVAVSAEFKGLNQNSYYQVLSRTDGTYTIYVDESLRGDPVYIRVKDEMGVVSEDLLMPPDVDTILVDSLVTLNFTLKLPLQFIAGKVMDQNSQLVPNIALRLQMKNGGEARDINANGEGAFAIGVYPGDWNIYLNNEKSPQFLMKYKQSNIVVAETSTTVNTVVNVFKTNSWITGKIIDPDNIYSLGNRGDFSLYINSTTVMVPDSMGCFGSTNIANDKSFSLPASTDHDSGYAISCGAWGNFPPNYFIFPPNPITDGNLLKSPVGKYLAGYNNVKAPADSINFYLRKGDGTMRVHLIDTVAGASMDGATVFFIDTVTHFYMIAHKASQNTDSYVSALPAGNYFVGAFSWSKNGGGQEGLIGPIALVDQDTSIELNLTPVGISGKTVKRITGRGFDFARITNSTVSFIISSPVSGHATVRIYNCAGKLVETLFNNEIGVGSRVIRSEQSSLKAGNLYIAKLSIRGPVDFQKTIPFTLIK